MQFWDVVLMVLSVGLGTWGAWWVAHRQMRLEASAQVKQDEARARGLARLLRDELEDGIAPLEELYRTASVGGKYEIEWHHYVALTQVVSSDVWDTFVQSGLVQNLPHYLETEFSNLYRLVRLLKRKVVAGKTRSALDKDHYKRYQAYTDDWEQVKRLSSELPVKIRSCMEELDRWLSPS